jgi:hypothetical protein
LVLPAHVQGLVHSTENLRQPPSHCYSLLFSPLFVLKDPFSFLLLHTTLRRTRPKKTEAQQEQGPFLNTPLLSP